MIGFLIANLVLDATVTIWRLIREKTQGGSEWGSGPSYTSMLRGWLRIMMKHWCGYMVGVEKNEMEEEKT